MTWNEFFKFPLMIDEHGGWVIAQPGKLGYRWAWDWIENDFICEYPIGVNRGSALAKNIVSFVNGETDKRPDYIWSADEYDPCVICINGQPCMEIRSWGELTGGLHLSQQEAAKIQDDFKNFIINKLNGKLNDNT